MPHCNSPIIKAKSNASPTYSSEPATAMPVRPAATNKLSMATGPTAR